MTTSSLSYYARDKESIKVYGFDPTKDNALVESKDPPFPLPLPKAALWSPDGSALALVDPSHGVQVLSFSNGEGQETVTHTLQGAPKTTQSFIWSPKSTVLVTVAPGAKGSQEHNIHVWRKDDGDEGYSMQASFCHPKLEKGAKVLQWTVDEALCARLLPDGQLHVMKGADLSSEPLVELKFSHAAQSFELAPIPARGNFKGRMAVFVPDIRDDLQRVTGPAEVYILELSSADGGLKSVDKAKVPVASGQLAELQWNCTGTALIAHCQTEVDETGSSYYGGSKLVLVSSDGEYQKDLMDGEDGAANSTAVQAVAWSPTRDEFILIHGFQPSQASLYAWDEKAKKVTLAKLLLEKAHRNTIRFNHFGSLVCLAGFGNLAGQVDFFGRADTGDEEKCDFVKISSCTANCTVSAQWAPDGRHFLTGVLAPRMRVDNGASIWRALTGTKVAATDFEELFDVQWRPEPPDSLRYLDLSAEEVDSASKELAKSGTSEGGATKKQAYRPPKARGEGASTVAAMMRGEVAAPDADDRRKRQPRQMRQREEEPNPSPRPDEPPWHQDRNNKEANQQQQHAEGPDSEQPSPEKNQQQQQRQQQQQQREQQQREQQAAQSQPRQVPPREPPPPQPQPPQQQAAQQREQQQREQQQRELQQREQQQVREQAVREAAQRELQQREQQQLQQQLQQVVAAGLREEHQRQQQLREREQQRELQQREQQAREREWERLQQQHHASPNRPPSAAEALHAAEIARMASAAAGGYPGQPQRVMSALQQQQHHQQQQAAAAYGRNAAQAGQHQSLLQQHLQQQSQLHHQQQLQAQAQHEAQQRQRQQQQQQQEAAARAAQQQRQAQQQASQGLSQHGSKRPCPASGWQYIDPKQNIQGPFTLLEMQQWNELGYFRPELPMRCDAADRFTPFSELFPHPLIPFQSYPKRPTRV